MQGELGVGEQHGDLRPRQALAAPLARRELHVVRQELDGAVEPALRFQRLHEPHREADVADAAPLGERHGERLQVVVAQHERGDLVGHLGEEGVARLRIEAAVALGRGQRDLDVDLDVGGVDAGRIVDGVGVEPDAAPRRLDAAASGSCRDWRLRRSPWRAARPPVTRMPSLARSPTCAVGLVGGPHVGADAAEEQQIDRRLEDGAHHLVGRRFRDLRGRAPPGPAASAGSTWPSARRRRRPARSALLS